MDHSLDGSRSEKSVWKQYRRLITRTYTSSFIISTCLRQTTMMWISVRIERECGANALTCMCCSVLLSMRTCFPITTFRSSALRGSVPPGSATQWAATTTQCWFTRAPLQMSCHLWSSFTCSSSSSVANVSPRRLVLPRG